MPVRFRGSPPSCWRFSLTTNCRARVPDGPRTATSCSAISPWNQTVSRLSSQRRSRISARKATQLPTPLIRIRRLAGQFPVPSARIISMCSSLKSRLPHRMRYRSRSSWIISMATAMALGSSACERCLTSRSQPMRSRARPWCHRRLRPSCRRIREAIRKQRRCAITTCGPMPRPPLRRMVGVI